MKTTRAGAKAPVKPDASSAKSEPKLGHDIQVKIGRQLRAIYDDVVNQGVPDKFVDLLNRLDEESGSEPKRRQKS